MGKFTKDDLQVNDIVTTRENKTYMVHQFDTDLILVSEVEFLYLDEYTEFLCNFTRLTHENKEGEVAK